MTLHKYGVAGDQAQQKVAFYLCDDFNMLPFIAAIEPLRIANRRSAQALYQCQVVTPDGAAVTASNGMQQTADCSIEAATHFDMVFICGPYDPDNFKHLPTLNWLKQQAREHALLGGLETGCHILAKAGLLKGVKCTTHWENMAQFQAEFPDHDVTGDVYEVDRRRVTCSGGAAALDMMLYLIEQTHGHELAASVADSMIHPTIRSPGEPQRMDLKSRIGIDHPTLLECIELMEANIEEPLTPNELARLIQVSKRQIERLFQRYLQTTPGRYYLALRLEAAHALLQISAIKVVEAALACGFKSSGHFSNCYQSRYGTTPREGRKR